MIQPLPIVGPPIMYIIADDTKLIISDFGEPINFTDHSTVEIGQMLSFRLFGPFSVLVAPVRVKRVRVIPAPNEPIKTRSQ
jgi:hypothetical protein